MQFGIFGSAQAQRGGPDVDSGVGFRDFVEYNIEAEALGYHSSFLVEHHFTGFGQVSATLNLLTWVAAKTRTLRLGTATMVLPWHNPVLLAEQAATIDLLSGGRLDFGIGKGYRWNEFKGFCVAMEEADARFDEALDVILRAWTSDGRWSHHGRYWQFEDVVVEPPTAQKPHPPIWMGAGSERSVRQVARSGFNLLLEQFASPEEIGHLIAVFRDEGAKNGRPFDPMQIAVTRAFFVTDDAAEKQHALDRRLKGHNRMMAVARRPDGPSRGPAQHTGDFTAANVDSAIYGSPDEIARKLEALRDAGAGYLLLNGAGSGGGERAQTSLRRFARELMPAFATPRALRIAG